MRGMLTEADIAAYRKGLIAAVEAGDLVLEKGGSALDAVCAAVASLEDNPLFNAGYGAVFTHEGTHELDSCVMDGQTRNAGAVAGVTLVKHPVYAARAVMEKSPYVLLVGSGADRFAHEAGVETVGENTYFDTERRRTELLRALSAGAHSLSEDAALPPDCKFGTVGAVALDANGHLAAATSTGGMTNKCCGRVGDSPIVGAGTYADDKTCAVSCTGHGEYFIRAQAAGDVAARMRYLGETLEQATQTVIESLKVMGGRGGLVSVDGFGNVSFAMNSAGMYRAMKRTGEVPKAAIFAEDPVSA